MSKTIDAIRVNKDIWLDKNVDLQEFVLKKGESIVGKKMVNSELLKEFEKRGLIISSI